jgi:adenine-specific DNA-methyltransferase
MPTEKKLLAEIEALKKKLEIANNRIKTEKYGITWLDVPEAFEEESENQLPILKEVKEKAIKTDNGKPTHLLIEGDNYHSLTCLNYTHKNKIDLIYIDPPYNTGSDGFRYKDKRILDKFPDGSDVPKEHPLRHSYWLSFMSKRLELAFSLLKKDGFMVASIDDNEVAQLKMLLDKYSINNTKIVAVKMSEASGLKMGATMKVRNIPKFKEYIIYAKPSGINNLHFDKISKTDWDAEYNIFWDNFNENDKNTIDEYGSKDDLNEDDLKVIDKILQKINIQSVSKKLSELNITKEKETKEWLFENSWRILRTAASSSVKRLADEKREYSKQNYFSVISSRDKLLYLVKGDYSLESKSPRVQFIFAEDNLKTHPGDIWYDIRTTGLEAEGGVSFKNGKKPLDLIERIIKSNTNKNSIVMDFFAGSGTTGEAVLRCNAKDNGQRQFILLTNNEEDIAEKVCYQRIVNTFNGYGSNIALPNSLKYYKTDFVGSNNILSATDEDKTSLAQNAGYLLSIAENTLEEMNVSSCFQFFENNKKVTAIYFKEELTEMEIFLDKVEKIRKPIALYLFSWSNRSEFETLFDHLDHVTIKTIPQPILEIYKKIYNIVTI